MGRGRSQSNAVAGLENFFSLRGGPTRPGTYEEELRAAGMKAGPAVVALLQPGVAKQPGALTAACNEYVAQVNRLRDGGNPDLAIVSATVIAQAVLDDPQPALVLRAAARGAGMEENALLADPQAMAKSAGEHLHRRVMANSVLHDGVWRLDPAFAADFCHCTAVDDAVTPLLRHLQNNPDVVDTFRRDAGQHPHPLDTDPTVLADAAHTYMTLNALRHRGYVQGGTNLRTSWRTPPSHSPEALLSALDAVISEFGEDD